jgi:two-component system sensor histidine kinase DesK
MTVGLAQGVDYGSLLELSLGPPLAAFFAYSSARRSELVYKLQETRAELARMAVAEERLRIARDLHDLLGHSLSLITIKAELAGRVIEADPRRAASEITDVEDVACRSLGEVRAAVTSYRQPSLAGELAAARQMLTAAGMDCQVHAPASLELSQDTDALLAWTVREGATNAVRHSGARRADHRHGHGRTGERRGGRRRGRAVLGTRSRRARLRARRADRAGPGRER